MTKTTDMTKNPELSELPETSETPNRTQSGGKSRTEMPYPGALALIESDIRAWAKLWEPKAATARRLPFRILFHLVFQYSGLRATIVYRISHGLWQARIPILPGMFQRLNLFWHGFDFPALVSVGPGLYVPHPVGITVMAKSIGSNVTLVGSITIGMRNELAFPIICDGVMVGAGARILGGITIGENAKIGANAVVTKDVPPGATAMGVPAVIKMPSEKGE